MSTNTTPQKFYFVFRLWADGKIECYDNTFTTKEEALKSPWWEEEHEKIVGRRIIMIPVDPATFI